MVRRRSQNKVRKQSRKKSVRRRSRKVSRKRSRKVSRKRSRKNMKRRVSKKISKKTRRSKRRHRGGAEAGMGRDRRDALASDLELMKIQLEQCNQQLAEKDSQLGKKLGTGFSKADANEVKRLKEQNIEDIPVEDIRNLYPDGEEPPKLIVGNKDSSEFEQ